MVHKAAVRTIRWVAHHLNPTQAGQAMRVIAAHAKLYRDKPFDLDDICDAALVVSRGDPVLRKFALRIINSILPTEEELVDNKLAEQLCREVEPDDEDAAFVATVLASRLAESERDSHNSYEFHERARFFAWLNHMPQKVFDAAEDRLIEAAYALAVSDPWECCHFASLFSRFGKHEAEAEVLLRAAEGLKNEKSREPFERTLRNLRQAALANAAKLRGQIETASSCVSKIELIEK